MTISPHAYPGELADWRQRLAYITDMMRQTSMTNDPQEMVRIYSQRVRTLLPNERFLSLSRRELQAPSYRITRSNLWPDQPNPWKEPHRLPLFDRGILGDLLYSDTPRMIDDFEPDPDDPAHEHLAGMRSLVSLPVYDRGVSMNMTVLLSSKPSGFDPDRFPELVWQSNLFGRATHNIVLAERLREAYAQVDQELQVVSEIQKSLLPAELPKIPGVDVAAYYQTSRSAGGDYYDFFPMAQGRWGILIADVAGHGTPAAVVMAITHSIAHAHPGPPNPPSAMLSYLNKKLNSRYATGTGNFVTAFYAIYDPAGRTLRYASAGHNPPRLCRCPSEGGGIVSLDEVQRLPLGVIADESYYDATVELHRGDKLVIYTDGIVEARNPPGQLFGLERLDALLSSGAISAAGIVADVIDGVGRFAEGRPADDDRTLVVARIL